MRALRIIGFGIACALCLTLFSQINDMLKYVFSLGALFLGIQFFKMHEEKAGRIVFVILTIILYFVFSLAYALYVAAKTGQLPAAP